MLKRFINWYIDDVFPGMLTGNLYQPLLLLLELRHAQQLDTRQPTRQGGP